MYRGSKPDEKVILKKDLKPAEKKPEEKKQEAQKPTKDKKPIEQKTKDKGNVDNTGNSSEKKNQ